MIALYTRPFSNVFQHSAQQISAKQPTFFIARLQLLRGSLILLNQLHLHMVSGRRSSMLAAEFFLTNQRFFCPAGTDKSTLGKDSQVHLRYNEPSDLGLLMLILIHPKGKHPKLTCKQTFYFSFHCFKKRR